MLKFSCVWIDAASITIMSRRTLLLALLPLLLRAQPTTHIEVGGASTKLDALGPVVVGKDGSLGLVSGWAEMSEQEREAAQRTLARRNAKRLEILQAEAEAKAAAEKQRGPVRRALGRVGRLLSTVASRCSSVVSRLRRKRPAQLQEAAAGPS